MILKVYKIQWLGLLKKWVKNGNLKIKKTYDGLSEAISSCLTDVNVTPSKISDVVLTGDVASKMFELISEARGGRIFHRNER